MKKTNNISQVVAELRAQLLVLLRGDLDDLRLLRDLASVADDVAGAGPARVRDAERG